METTALISDSTNMVYDTFHNQRVDEYVPSSKSHRHRQKHLNYSKYWLKHQAKIRRCCGGFCITGPKTDIPTNIFVWGLIVVPSILFFIFAAPSLAEITIALPIVYVILFFFIYLTWVLL